MNGKAFLGSGLRFPLQIDPRTGKISIVSHEEDIEQAIGIIIRTARSERVMRPEFGSNIDEYVFSTMRNTQTDAIAYEIHEQLILLEPRIVDVQVHCTEEETTEGRLIISVEYTVRSTNNRYNKVYPFYILEGVEQ